MADLVAGSTPREGLFSATWALDKVAGEAHLVKAQESGEGSSRRSVGIYRRSARSRARSHSARQAWFLYQPVSM